MTILAELLLAIASFFLELTANVLAVTMSSTYMAKRSAGLRRVFYAVAVIAGIHLLSGLILGSFKTNSLLLLSILFSPWTMIASLFILFFSLLASASVDHSFAQQGNTTDTPKEVPFIVFQIASFALVIGAVSIYFAYEERT